MVKCEVSDVVKAKEGSVYIPGSGTVRKREPRWQQKQFQLEMYGKREAVGRLRGGTA